MTNQLPQHHQLRFPTQRPGEHVVLLLRRNWTVLARNISYLILLLIIPPLLFIGMYVFTEFRINPASVSYILIVEGVSIYYLFSLLAYFHSFVDYHLDIWVVTDQRIVSIEQEGLFQRVISELNILKIQDVTSEVKGKVQTFLDYGQVYIQTAGKAERFIFEQVSHPAEVEKIILQVHDRANKMNELEQVRETEQYRHEIDEQYDATHVAPGSVAGAVKPIAPGEEKTKK
ncbi:MAG: PH domain-containing protein [Candidatus Kerfeldbacteria bacterium]|nr:PH domain-containing protein [Candidatus Kerfeldbacteria bacterium]